MKIIGSLDYRKTSGKELICCPKRILNTNLNYVFHMLYSVFSQVRLPEKNSSPDLISKEYLYRRFFELSTKNLIIESEPINSICNTL